MTIDPRFSLSITEEPGRKAFRICCAKDLVLEESATPLFAAPFDELCELALVPLAARPRFADSGSRTIFSNGWQSWSFAGELAEGERVLRSRIVPHLNVYTDGPCPNEGHDEVRSYFLTFVRGGEGRLFLVSKGSSESATPPVAFRIDRKSLAVRAEASARGGKFLEGQLVAEIGLYYREGYFEAKDALAEAFRGYGHFDRLGFLGAKGSDGKPGSLVPGGYESWYNHYTHIDDAIISGDLASIGSNENLINSYYLGRGKPTVFQIDDGWEAAVGQWEPDPKKFPRGMKAFAWEIEDKGMIPGIWIAPLLVTKSSAAFREHADWILRDEGGRPVPAGYNPGWDGVFYCLDISLREVEDYLGRLFDTIVEEWGYRYLKLDFLYAGFLEGSRGALAARQAPGAAYEHYERLMRRLTSRIEDSRGLGVAYLGCGAPLESSFRHFPLMRIGADTKGQWEDGLLKTVVRHQGRPAAYTNLTHTIGRSLLDKTVFVNDPDVVFCRTDSMKLSDAEKELVALVDLTLASQIMFSDDTHEFGGAEEAAFTARIVDLYDALAGGEYGAERVAKDVYSVFSRDEGVKGIINLSEKRYFSDEFAALEPIVAHMKRGDDGKAYFEPHSVSLFAFSS